MNARSRGRRVSWGSIVWLTLVWVLLWGRPTPLTVVSGVVMALTALVIFPLPRVRVSLVVRPIATVVLVSRFLWDLTVASIEVSWLAIAQGPRTRGAVMDIELAGNDELLQTLTAEMVALVPGTVVIDLEPGPRLLILHALSVTNRREAQQVRQRVLAQEARVLRAFHPDPDSFLDPRRRPPVEQTFRHVERDDPRDLGDQIVDAFGREEHWREDRS